MISQLSSLRLSLPLLSRQVRAGTVSSPLRQFTTTTILRSTTNRLYSPYVCTFSLTSDRSPHFLLHENSLAYG